jgi:hypothetical protein
MRAFIVSALTALALATPVAAQQSGQVRVTPPAVIVTPPTPQPSQSTASGVSRVWALPALEIPDSGLNCIYITNMSLTPVRITARVVSQHGGSNAAADALYNRQLGEFRPGHQRHACWLSSDREAFPAADVSYWLVLSANAPVAITGFVHSSLGPGATGGSTLSQSHVRTPLAVDCARPAGFEFVCAVAEGRFPPERVVVPPPVR